MALRRRDKVVGGAKSRQFLQDRCTKCFVGGRTITNGVMIETEIEGLKGLSGVSGKCQKG